MNKQLKQHLESINEILSKENKAFFFVAKLDEGILTAKNINEPTCARLMFEYINSNTELADAFVKVCSEQINEPVKDISKAE